MHLRGLLSLALLPLAACNVAASDNAVQKFSFDDIAGRAEPILGTSPDVTNAVWSAGENNQSARFGLPDEAPMLTLACEMPDKASPVIHIVRNTPADPGAKALLALLGNAMNARLAVETHAHDGTWRWESEVAALDPQLDVFMDGGAVEATVPGGGTLKLAASSEPARVITACRQHGMAQASDQSTDAAKTPAEPA
jgi:hypothetical protein